MNIKQGRYKLSIFIKLLIGLLLVIAPLYLLGLFINLSGANDIRKEISKSISEKMDYYLNTLESEVERIITVQREYLNDSNILRLSVTAETMSDYERIQNILNVMSYIQMLNTLSPYVKNVNVHIPLLNRTISINNSIDNLNLEEMNALKSYTSLYGSPIILWNDRLFLNVPYVDPKLTYSKEPIFDLSIELSQTVLQEDLDKFVTYPGSEAIIISEEDGWIIGKDADMVSYARDFVKQNETNDIMLGQEITTINKKEFLLVYKKSSFLKFTLLAFIPEEEILAPLDNYKRLSWILSGLSIFIILIFAIWLYKLVMQPLDRLVGAFGQVEKGNLDVSIYRKNNDEFKYLYEQFNEMVINIKFLLNQMYEQRTRVQKAELKQLQYQINPHFLYNSIFLIYRMAKLEDYDNIIRLSQHLGTYYQFITRSAKLEIPLEDEMNHAKDYIEIQNIRFGDRIKVKWEQTEGDYTTVLVPRLIMQPFIENAYYHGLGNKLKDGKINVSITVDHDRINISIQDNGLGIEGDDLISLQNSLSNMSQEIETTAILNIHRRLQIRYGGSSGVTVSKGELGGLKFTIDIFLKGKS